jgi:hypothetical protein
MHPGSSGPELMSKLNTYANAGQQRGTGTAPLQGASSIGDGGRTIANALNALGHIQSQSGQSQGGESGGEEAQEHGAEAQERQVHERQLNKAVEGGTTTESPARMQR